MKKLLSLSVLLLACATVAGCGFNSCGGGGGCCTSSCATQYTSVYSCCGAESW